MQYYKHPKIRRTIGKLKRETLKVPIVRDIHKRRYEQVIERHACKLPNLNPSDAKLLNILKKRLLLVTNADELSIPSTKLILDSADRLVRRLKTYSHHNEYFIKLPQNILLKYPEIFLWGLNQRLLDIVENYIGIPVYYHGSTLSKNIASSQGDEFGVRQWHIDPEDYRVIKIIIYLNDVDIGTGPFEYISKDLSENAIFSLNYDSGYISDDIFEKHAAPKKDWKTCTGPKGTIIMTDTGRLFHRAKPSSTGDRFALTYSYTSRTPKGLSRTWNYSHEWRKLLEARLDSSQMRYLYL